MGGLFNPRPPRCCYRDWHGSRKQFPPTSAAFSHRKIRLHATFSGGAISGTGPESRPRHPVRRVAPPRCDQQRKERAMQRRRVFRLIAILFTMWALLDLSAAEARTPRPPRPPRPPRRCHPGALCQHGTGVCNDAGQCCGTSEFACGTSCCNALPNVGCCDGACVYTDTEENCGGCGNVCHGGKFCTDGVCACRGGETDCNGFCANLLWDNLNCGACGTQCAEGFSCFLGTCRCADSGQSSATDSAST